ncbi:calcium-binding protein 8 isoform X3 [Mesocricetus auratus]|uniref:Calcium-binding protein 8 isoform X3 n=1 Tax=Mesocricetus auratus TaxID=10036 RepID=A0ABM2W9F8_MESAU|nr:calcium-binding protein 8 isoform X3 [Mesocricetus auratus]
MRLPEQPGDGKPENETKGDQESPEGGEEPRRSPAPDFPTWQVFPPNPKPLDLDCFAAPREKMPFHHVTAGLLYKGNYLNRSLSAGSDSEQLANISVEELDEIREAFRVLDRDGNGFISKQELGMAMRSLGYMPSEVELAIIMQRLDMDGDGQVDFDEFMTILGPKLVSSEGRDGFLGNTIDSIFWQVSKTLLKMGRVVLVLKQEECYEFEASIGYKVCRVSPCLTKPKTKLN